jgi:hypothetical protein
MVIARIAAPTASKQHIQFVCFFAEMLNRSLWKFPGKALSHVYVCHVASIDSYNNWLEICKQFCWYGMHISGCSTLARTSLKKVSVLTRLLYVVQQAAKWTSNVERKKTHHDLHIYA